MSKCTGIVMELGNNHAIIMTNSGEFLKVASGKNKPVLGEIFSGEALKRTPIFKYAVTAASLLFILLFGSSAYAYYTPVASLQVDINPSLRLDINRWNRIIKYTALNTDGEKVLSEISLKNKPINDGLHDIVDEAKKDNFIDDNYVSSGKVISVSIENNKNKSVDLSEFSSYISNINLKLNISETVKTESPESSKKVVPSKNNSSKNNISKGNNSSNDTNNKNNSSSNNGNSKNNSSNNNSNGNGNNKVKSTGNSSENNNSSKTNNKDNKKIEDNTEEDDHGNKDNKRNYHSDNEFYKKNKKD